MCLNKNTINQIYTPYNNSAQKRFRNSVVSEKPKVNSMPKGKGRGQKGKSRDELLANKSKAKSKEKSNDDHMINPQVPPDLMSSMGDTSSSLSSSSKKKKKTKQGSPELISLAAVQSNMNELHKTRVFSSIAAGIAAGILDLKGIYGFALFIIVFFITSVLMMVKMKMNLSKYVRPATKFITTSSWDGLMSFILFWTFFANVLYLYG